MPTTHTWKTGAYGFLYDPTEYTDGTAFAPGDTLVFSSGTPDAANGTLATGTYQANTTGASIGLHLVNVTENSSTSISVADPLTLQWMGLGIFVNNGALSLGTPSSPGNVYYSLFDNVGSDGSFTNNGTMTLQNASGFTFDRGVSGDGNFVNAAGALLSISSGSGFYGTGFDAIAHPVFENEGRIEMNGAVGRIASFEPLALYGGAGVLAVKGAAGDKPSDTIATFSGSTSGRMDLSSGELLFNSDFDTGPNVTINFLDNNGLVFNAESETGGIIGTLRSGHPLQATINGFVAGDVIDYQLEAVSTLEVPSVTLAYDTASHVLTVAMYAGEVSRLTFNGTYSLNDFHITQTQGLYTTIALTTTSTSNAIASAPGGGPPPPSPDPLVNNAYYLANNPDVAVAGVSPYAHYMAYGAQEGRNPDAFFDTNYYLAQNPDVKAAGVNPLAQFEAYGWKEGRDPSLAFSDAKYLAANPDVAAAKLDPLAHFLTYGQAEGRMAFLSGGTAAADPLVDAAYYDPQLGATIIPTGAAAAQQAAFSYDAAGWQRHLNPDAYFDTGYYLAHNPDVAAAHIDPLAHYEAYGWKEGRDPSAAFSTGKYLAANPDVRAARIDPLLHYVAYGQAEGRAAFHV